MDNWRDINEAIYLVGQAYGHHTAHLDPVDQIRAAKGVINDMVDTISELYSEANPQVKQK